MCDHNNSLPETPKTSIKSTTPSSFKVKNPFERVLISKLHKSICSPGMCKRYKQNSTDKFDWDIHQKCELAPAQIDVCNSQFEPSPDPVLEKIAEEAVERFFSQEKILPSPLDVPVKTKPLQVSSEEILAIEYEDKETYIRDASAQTVLTLPPVLPPELEKVLAPYFTFTEDQQAQNDLSANASLRRKLHFEEHSVVNYEDTDHSEDEPDSHSSPQVTAGHAYKPHTPLLFSPVVGQDVVLKSTKRTFFTPVSNIEEERSKIKSKLLQGVDLSELHFSPIVMPCTLKRPASLLNCELMSPVHTVISTSEDEEEQTQNDTSANASLRRKLLFEEHNVVNDDCSDHSDKENVPSSPLKTDNINDDTSLHSSPVKSLDALSKDALSKGTYFSPVSSTAEETLMLQNFSVNYNSL